MQKVYEEVKTPYKYGLVLVTDDNKKNMDCPTVFRKNGQWWMTYIIFDGRGYETWLAQSKDLLKWETKGKILPFTDTTDWDTNQKAGYVALQDPKWGGSYECHPYAGKYWLSYFGGNSRGYEKGMLSIGHQKPAAGGKTTELKASNTGFYTRKAVDPNIASANVQYSGTDWIEIRYAEVLLNLAESACGTNNLSVAMDQLKAIRKRAGIEAGTDGNYGLQAGMSRAQLFDAILYERQIELAFEGKRF